jgi:1-acyl-sn-glycerol-3-phosphate acyltransferase
LLVTRIDCCFSREESVFRRRRPASRSAQCLRLLRSLKEVARIGLGASLVLPRLALDDRRSRARDYSRRLLEALGFRVDVRGRALGESGAILLAANHVSWLDVCAIGTVSAAPFVAKAEMLGWPMMPRVARLFETLFLVRTSPRDAARVKGEVAAKLREGRAVTVFPESTTSNGAMLGRFYPALFQAAVDAAAWVQPVAIRYRGTDGFPTDAPAFLGEMTIFDSLGRILAEKEIGVELTFCEPIRAAGSSRRELAAASHAAIAAVLGFDCGQRRLAGCGSKESQSATRDQQAAITRSACAR